MSQSILIKNAIKYSILHFKKLLYSFLQLTLQYTQHQRFYYFTASFQYSFFITVDWLVVKWLPKKTCMSEEYWLDSPHLPHVFH